MVLVVLFVVTIFVLVWSGVWFNIVVTVGIGIVSVVLHFVLKSIDDLCG